MKPFLPTPEETLRLAEKHLQRYRNLLVLSRMYSGYRPDELRNYITIWQSIKAKGGVFIDLTQEERDEVVDAVDDHAAELFADNELDDLW